MGSTGEESAEIPSIPSVPSASAVVPYPPPGETAKRGKPPLTRIDTTRDKWLTFPSGTRPCRKRKLPNCTNCTTTNSDWRLSTIPNPPLAIRPIYPRKSPNSVPPEIHLPSVHPLVPILLLPLQLRPCPRPPVSPTSTHPREPTTTTITTTVTTWVSEPALSSAASSEVWLASVF